MRRIGVLTNLAADDAEGQARNAAFAQALAQLGWAVGQNLQIEHRWAAGDADRIRRYAAELVALTPDVILATGAAGVAPLLQATRTVPVVFVLVPDPVGAGFVASLARPGGNATGFVQFEYGISGKWLELLKEIAPGVTRVAVLRDPAIAAGQGQFAAIQAVAPSFGVEVTPINVRDTGEIERAIAAFAHTSRDGLIVTASALTVFHRDLIVTLAARYKLPAVYVQRLFVTSWRPDLLWGRCGRPVPARGRLRRPHPQGREACRSAGAGTDQVRVSRSTSKPLRRSASKCRRRCSPAPTR